MVGAQFHLGFLSQKVLHSNFQRVNDTVQLTSGKHSVVVTLWYMTNDELLANAM
jgi:hypothetical protein